MNSTLRKETPDSEAVASSEDERPWPRAPSFGTLPRKENGVPGIGGGIWSTQRHGSFKMEKGPPRAILREARLGAANQSLAGFRPDSTPSPSASDGSGVLPFSIPMQPTPKAGRSLSHSQGQREAVQAARLRSGSDERNMSQSLAYLPEEIDTETESDLGGGLTHTTSHPPIGTLQRTTTLPHNFESMSGYGHYKDSSTASGRAHTGARGDRKLEAALTNMSLDPAPRRSQWQSHLGWDDVTNTNESRRHSLADIPTRRGSLVGADGRPLMSGGSFWPNGHMYDWEEEPASQDAQGFKESQHTLDYGATRPRLAQANESNARSDTLGQLNYNDKHDQGPSSEIPTMYKVPQIQIAEHERTDQDRRGPASTSNAGQWGGTPGRPRKQLYIVSFKCSRVDVFYLLDNTGLLIKEGDIVIVEADRGQDLGTVQHANVTPDDARLYKRKYGEEQYKWLMMFSKNKQSPAVKPNAQHYGENNSGGRANQNIIANASTSMQGSPRDNFNNLKPKAIKRLANTHEIKMLTDKEGNEAKAKRACQQKVAHLHLDMEILDAEWQWDFQKLIFYYYADHYINFKDLITELYRIYKTRIWLSAINPASFSQHALGQPPSGIGPGAVGGFNPNINNTYTMMYGADPDPYGAVPPYRIGYETYTPNYPGIPGVANSFAPNPNTMGGGGFQGYGGGGGDASQSMLAPTGGPAADYGGYYFDRSGSEEPTPKAFTAANPFAGSATPTEAYNPMYAGPPGNIPAGFGDRGVFGFGYQAFGAGGGGGGGGAGPSNVASGLGRQATLPPPIGTRPPSSGNPTPTLTSGQHTGGRVPGQQSQGPMPPYLGGLGPHAMPGQPGPPYRGNWARLSGNETVSKAEVMRNYLAGLQGKDGGGPPGGASGQGGSSRGPG